MHTVYTKRCYDCGWNGGGHDSACPELTPKDPTRRTQYKSGWSDGRLDKPKTSDDPTYLLGYGRGIVALEEFENGFDPVWDE